MVSSTSIEITPTATQKEAPADYSALLLLPIAAIAVHQYSKKQMRGLERKMRWQFFKTELKSMLRFKKSSGKGLGLKLLLVLLGLGFVIAIGVFLSWSIALIFLVVFGLIALIYSAKD